MIRSAITLLLIFGFLLGIADEARAWSSDASRTAQKIRILEMEVKLFRSDYGALPSLEELHDYLRPEGYPDSDFANPFIDNWHREIIYRIPGIKGDFDLHSVGEDGIDDNGDKDDISNWRWVNDGYYWMRWWPLGRFMLMATVSLAILILISRLFQPWRAAGPVAGAVLGLGISFGCWFLLHPGRVPERNDPLELGILGGCIIVLPSLVILFMRFLFRQSEAESNSNPP